jgi:uncharacterized membrane protein
MKKAGWIRLLVTALFCLAGAALNCFLDYFLAYRLALPVYGDTLFTVTATLAGGLIPGIATGALTNLLIYPLISSVQYSLEAYLFALCSVAVALVTWLFSKLLPQRRQKFEDHLSVCVVLITLTIALVVVESVGGGLIASFFANPISGPEALLQFSFYQNGLPRIATEMLSRVPVNLLDRPLAVFGGYGAALLVKAAEKRFSKLVL